MALDDFLHSLLPYKKRNLNVLLRTHMTYTIGVLYCLEYVRNLQNYKNGFLSLFQLSLTIHVDIPIYMCGMSYGCHDLFGCIVLT